METFRHLRVGRRQFIGGAGAAMLGSCISCPDELTAPWQAGTREINDIHAHFFNMSDLPMRGFVTHVLVANRAPHLQAVWDAIADVADWMKDWSPTVREELRGLHLPIGELPERDISADRAARALSRRINARAGLPGGRRAVAGATIDLTEPAPDLAGSYLALATLLNGLRDESKTLVPVGGPVSADRIESILTGTEPALANLSDERRENPCRVDRTQCLMGECDEPPPESLSMQAREIKTLLKWIWDMMQGRCNHVRNYLALTRSGPGGETWRPKIVVHHLVDYDAWLGDAPDPASSHDDQIDFWTRFAAREPTEIELVTFAGYDPLKHAEQRLLGEPISFERLKGYYGSASGPRISGFKLYPPMGFKPWGNADPDYRLPLPAPPQRDRRRERARGIVSRRWDGHPRLAGKNIGDEINASLIEFFDFCLRRGAPILSHAIRGNQADCCFGQRADPAHWVTLFQREPRFRALRLCLGHIVADAECFVHSVMGMQGPNPPPPPAHVWALHGIATLLEMSSRGEADVYVDISYLSEILKPTLAEAHTASKAFFTALKFYCQRYDPRCERILFGSDWIVIGWELDYGRYVDLVRYGMVESGWPVEWQQNFMTENLKRFLGRA